MKNTKDKVTLYIATHNKTGLKYFGKTVVYFTNESLQKNYHGSGSYWKKHIKKHGDDVTVVIYGIYSLDETADDYVKPIALKFSEDNNIVKALNESGDRKGKKAWANLEFEDGLKGAGKGRVIREITKQKYSDTVTKPFIIDNTETSIAKERTKKANKTNQELVLFEGELITKKQKQIKNQVKTKNKKVNNTRTYNVIAEKISRSHHSASQEIKEKRSKEMSIIKNTLTDNNLTVAQNSGKKCSKTLLEKVIYNDKEMTRASMNSMKRQTKLYNILIDGTILHKKLRAKELKEFSQVLISKTKNNYMGLSAASRRELIKNNKDFMIGWYVETYEELYDVLQDKDVELHIDVSPNKENGSNIVHNAAVGYIKGMTGIDCKVKPEAFAASCVADHFVKA